MTELLALALAGALVGSTAEPAPHDAPGPPSPEAAEDAARADAEGRRHFEAGNFAEAAALYARAHAQDPRPIYLYHWAQAERRAGNCPVAAQLYRRYLEYDVGPENEAAAKKNLARCGYADEPVDTVEPAVPVDEAKVGTPSGPAPRDRNAWLRDPWGITLVGLGGGGLLAAAILGGGSSAQLDRAGEATVGTTTRAMPIAPAPCASPRSPRERSEPRCSSAASHDGCSCAAGIAAPRRARRRS
jgi:tetratricopeptide (TPR) repeat protein